MASTTFTVGQRVQEMRFGIAKVGTVTRTADGVRTRNTDGRIVWVLWDGEDVVRETWRHAVSIAPLVAEVAK